jgi:hypothetical protein
MRETSQIGAALAGLVKPKARGVVQASCGRRRTPQQPSWLWALSLAAGTCRDGTGVVVAVVATARN